MINEIEMSIPILLKGVMETFQSILRTSIYEGSFTEEEMEVRLEGKKQLRKALRTCTFGDSYAKIFVKDYIRDILIKKYEISKDNIDDILPFGKKQELGAEDKFAIMLYLMKEKYKENTLEWFIEEYHLSEPKIKEDGQLYYEITENEIHSIYDTTFDFNLHFHDKIDILTQKIYQMYKGNGVIDEIRDMKIDGVSGGVSGVSAQSRENLPMSYESVWLFFQGKSIRLSFLSFGSEKELIRVCKNIGRYGNQGQLSETRGYVVNEMMDGSRISVARPPFSESWVFFVRKFDNILQSDIQGLIQDKQGDMPICIMKWLIKGCQVTGVTGEQGVGKSTLLVALIQFIAPIYNLRIHELSFELHLRKIYPERNIVSFRETSTTTGQEGLDFAKKTDGTVSILGEVASAPVANWLVQMSMAASLFTLFTHHAKTAEGLVLSLRNALLQEGGFQNERIATEQVVDTINFDIHMKKSEKGHRYIERITEIIPLKESMIQSDLSGAIFTTQDIVVFKEESYHFVQNISDGAIQRINKHLSEEDQEKFRFDLMEWRKYELLSI